MKTNQGFFVRSNFENKTCIWDENKNLVCVFQNEKRDLAKPMATAFNEHAALNAVAEAARLIEGCSEIRPNETPGGYKRRILEPVMEALKNLQSIRNHS